MKLKTLIIASTILTKVALASSIFTPKITTEKTVAEYFHKLLPTTTIKSIYTTPYPDTYALILGNNIVYGNTHANYLTVGHMFDIYTRNDITDELQKQITPKVDISQIDTSDALVSKAPSKVTKKLIVYIDPDCPYCRQLETQMYEQGIDKKADIYYMLMPLAMHPNAKAHSSNILCSTDGLATLKDYMLKNNDNPEVKLKKGCDISAALERIGSSARNLSITGAPAIVTGDGTMIMGADIQAINDYVNKK